MSRLLPVVFSCRTLLWLLSGVVLGRVVLLELCNFGSQVAHFAIVVLNKALHYLKDLFLGDEIGELDGVLLRSHKCVAEHILVSVPLILH